MSKSQLIFHKFVDNDDGSTAGLPVGQSRQATIRRLNDGQSVSKGWVHGVEIQKAPIRSTKRARPRRVERATFCDHGAGKIFMSFNSY